MENPEVLAAAVEGPLADTVDGLKEQLRLVQQSFTIVEALDQGAGYQFFQVLLMKQIREREAAINERIAFLESPIVEYKHCPMCGQFGPPADDDGHCSYSCASGSGATGDWRPTTCSGCRDNQPNQLAHMDPGGCLYTEEC